GDAPRRRRALARERAPAEVIEAPRFVERRISEDPVAVDLEQEARRVDVRDPDVLHGPERVASAPLSCRSNASLMPSRVPVMRAVSRRPCERLLSLPATWPRRAGALPVGARVDRQYSLAMKKFLVLYKASTAAFEQMMKNTTPEQQKAGMDAWMAWGKKAASSIVDMGAPLGKSIRVAKGGAATPVVNDLGGYS